MTDLETALLEAARRGDASAVVEFLSVKPELTSAAGDYAKTALHWAAEKDHADVARVLLDAGADIEAKTSWGATPLAWAAVMGSRRVADVLLGRGASGYTVTVAAALGHHDRVVAMVESGDPHRPVLDDALHGAARNGHARVVAYLLGRGADVNARGFFAASALHWAAHNGHADMVALLVSRGANLTLEDEQFHATADAWAEEGGHPEIAERLRSSRGRNGD